jgi:hypothetical protein
MRSLFVGIASSVWFFLFVLSFIGTYRVSDQFLGAVLVVVAVGVLATWRIRALDDRLVRARTDGDLLVAYRAGLFIGIGWAELPAFVAFVLAFVAGTVWVYVAGAMMSSIDLRLVAPSRRNIFRIQGRLNAAGSPTSLGRILTSRGEPGGD